MRLKVLSCAEEELADAVEYYNGQRPGLGYEFASEVQRTFDRIRSFPTAWVCFARSGRCCLTNRFPYGVVYQIRQDHILVVGIRHMKRNPRRWQDRLGGQV